MKRIAAHMHGVLDRFWRFTAFPFREVFADVDAALPRAQLIVRVAYIICFGYALSFVRSVEGLRPPSESGLLWQVAWVNAVPFHTAYYAILAVAATGCLLAALYTEVRLFRIVAFLGMFEFQGLRFSYGKIDHSAHTWIFALFLFIFLTRLGTKPTAVRKRAYLEIFWGIQLVTLTCYTIAGLQKLRGAWSDWSHGGMTVFHPDSFGTQVAQLTLRGGGGGVLDWLVIDYSWLGFPLTLFMLYLETTAILVAFRPRLHRYWAAGFIAMHAGTGLIMNIWFDTMVTMVGLFLLLSPFDTARPSFSATLRDLPWLGPFLAALVSRWRRAATKGPVTVFYDNECVMCDSFVRVLLRAGVPERFRFASQQGATWDALLAEKPYLNGPDTVVILSEEGGQRAVRIRSEGVLWTLGQLRLPYALLVLALLVPLPLLNMGYRVTARLRKYLNRLAKNACPVPPPEFRDRFID